MRLFRPVFASLIAIMLLAPPWSAVSEDTPQPKSTRMTCGTCPEGYAKTGVTVEASICPEDDHMLVECVPLGTMNLMAVCGSCPDGYRQIGSSSVPVRCGNVEGGLMSQCQLEKLENTMPDPNRGGVFCPPNCAGQMPAPGQGTLDKPKKFLPPPKETK
ncbi:MAG TPA: hypothetical protein VGQ60_00195 [Nitrospiraceae bacterium]|jgi:hypothetical protein|nr:hypothetical protein [Nitrospiraceae bacterium]